MSTTYSKKPRIPIPKDIQKGDILILRNGRRGIWEKWDNNGNSLCEGLDPGGHYPDGRWWGRRTFAPHKWDVVAIERKIDRALDEIKEIREGGAVQTTLGE